MIRASISEAKNRLSHFIRLVRGGEDVEIVDRGTPVARLVHVSRSDETGKDAAWLEEAERLGLITKSQNREAFPPGFFDTDKMPADKTVLQALLEERERGR
ncbi:MAG: type II toxin-antitoxin system Phd/YefM family antitoxin [Syntrophobacteraceae bacterium]